MTIPVYNMTDSWTDGGTVYTALKMDVANTAAAANSKVVDFLLNTASAFYITPIAGFPSIGVCIIPNGFQCNGNIGATNRGVAFGYLGAVADLSFGSDVAIDWCSTTNCVGTVDTSVFRTAPGVVAYGTSSTSNKNGWFQWGGQARASGDFPKSADTSLANITGITVNVQAGRTYSFTAEILYTCTAAGGVKAAIAGTCTATDIIYNGYIVDSGANGIKGNTQAAALATTVASATTTGTDGVIRIMGTITVNAAGTLTVQFAQNTATGTSTAKRGSFFIVSDMP